MRGYLLGRSYLNFYQLWILFSYLKNTKSLYQYRLSLESEAIFTDPVSQLDVYEITVRQNHHQTKYETVIEADTWVWFFHIFILSVLFSIFLLRQAEALHIPQLFQVSKFHLLTFF